METAEASPCSILSVTGEKIEVGGENSMRINSRRPPAKVLRSTHTLGENKSSLNPRVNEFVPKNNFSGDVKEKGHSEHSTVTTESHSIPLERDKEIASLEFKLSKCQQKMNWLEENNRELKESISLSSASKRMMLDEKKKMEKELIIARYTARERATALEREKERVADLTREIQETKKKFADLTKGWDAIKRRLHDRIDIEVRRRAETIEIKNKLIKEEKEARLDYMLAKNVIHERNQYLERNNEEWIGRVLKLKFILDEIQKLCLLPEDHAEWILPMIEDIEIPEVSGNIRRRFLPSHEDAHMEFASEQDETELYEILSREATEYSAILGENPVETIASCVTIQKIIRGFLMRKKFKILYGSNPPERISASVMIQRVFRGCSSRLLLLPFYPPRHHFKNNGAVGRKSINFINTGNNTVNIRWVRGDGTFGNPVKVEKDFTRFGARISTFTGHWFNVTIKRPEDGWEISNFIRIPFNFINNSYYDTHTRILLTSDQWSASSTYKQMKSRYQEQFIGSVGLHNLLDMEDGEKVLPHEMGEEEISHSRMGLQDPINDEDDPQIRLAVHMSLDMIHSVLPQVDYGESMVSMFDEETDDVEDYGIDLSIMFRTPSTSFTR